VNTAFGDREMA